MVVLVYSGELRPDDEFQLGDLDGDESFNTEHIYPQSRLNTEESVSDLHLLRVADVDINSERLNYPFTEGSGEYKLVGGDSWYPGDERGIDVALLYRSQSFVVTNSQARKLMIYDEDKRDYTRDQLVVSGIAMGQETHFIVNHWPSRSGGEAKSSYKREKAAMLNKRIIDSIYQEDPKARIIGMGDFNDDPTNKSFKKFLQTKAEIQDLKEFF